jgi:3'(2'), 5'-bisphosphate nucleotidase
MTEKTIGPRDAIIDGFARTCVEAGEAILAIYNSDFDVVLKADASPVTAADSAAEAIILHALAALLPGIPVIAEEEVAAGRIPQTDGTFLLVDPLDGTKEFVGRRGDFTVNIALVEEHVPTLGVVYAPVERRLFAGDTSSGSAWTALVDADGRIGERQPLRVRPLPAGGLSAVASRSHNSEETQAYLDQFDVADRVSRGSSLKICMVAGGEADLYPRLGPTSEWDIAAGDAILRAAGGKLHGPDGEAMRYGKARFFNAGFVAAGDIDPPPIGPFMKN